MWSIIEKSLPQLLLAAVQYTIPLAVISFTLGLLLALITAIIRLKQARGALKILRALFSFYVWLFRSTPLLVQLFIVYFGLPYLKIKGLFPDGIKLDPFLAGVLTFSLNTGAYASETIRAAILAVPTGQWEAAAALGFTSKQTLQRIIIPQALKISIPPLANSFIGLVKDTSLAASITIVEMFEVSQQIAAENYQPLLMYSLVALIYAVICSGLSWLQGQLETKFHLTTTGGES